MNISINHRLKGGNVELQCISQHKTTAFGTSTAIKSSSTESKALSTASELWEHHQLHIKLHHQHFSHQQHKIEHHQHLEP